MSKVIDSDGSLPVGIGERWAAAVRMAQMNGYLETVGEIGENAFAAGAPHGWAAAARELASYLPGTVTPNVGAGGIGYKCGGGGSQGNIVSVSSVASIEHARRIVAELIPWDDRPRGLPWSLGGAARMMLVWAAPAQPHDKTLEGLIGAESDMKEYMYHDCEPGRYDNLTMWDCESYFYALLLRLPSLYVSLGSAWGRDKTTGEPGPRRLRWGKFRPDERERWADVLAACHDRDNKVLRNSLWGASLGSLTRKVAYTSSAPKGPDGKRLPWEPGRVREIHPVYGPGPFRNAALVLARGAAEMCAIASEQVGSVYSTVDSVTARDDREPKIWIDKGLPVRPKHEGPGDIVARGMWRIHDRVTTPYAPMVKVKPASIDPRTGRAVPAQWERNVDAALAQGYTCKNPPQPVARQTFDAQYHEQWL